MFLYAVAVLPLIRPLASKQNFAQCWYTDDSACVGKLSLIRLWLDKLIQLGPAYGYFAEPTKRFFFFFSVVAPQYERLLQRLGDYSVKWSSLPWRCGWYSGVLQNKRLTTGWRLSTKYPRQQRPRPGGF